MKAGFRLSGIAIDLSPLRESRAYRYLMLGQTAAHLGKHMRLVAVAWQVYAITNSSVAVGLIGLSEVIPLLAFSAFAGTLADSQDRKRVMWWSQVASVTISLALGFLAFLNDPPLLTIYALSAAAATAEATGNPARMAIIPTLVGWRRIAPAFALGQIIFQLTQIAGPALGGLLIGRYSVGVVYMTDAALFAFAVVALRPVPSQKPVRSSSISKVEAIKEGIRWALGRRLLRSIFLLDFGAMVFGMPRALFPELADSVFEIGASGVGLLYAAPAAGALIGAMLSGWVTKVPKQGIAILTAVVVWGVSISVTAVALPNLRATLLFLAIAGGADVLSAVFRGTMLHQNTPDELRGRVTSVSTLATTGGPRLGDVEAGAAAALIGLRGSILFGGVACLVMTAVIALCYPELRRFKQSQAPSPTIQRAPLTEGPENDVRGAPF